MSPPTAGLGSTRTPWPGMLSMPARPSGEGTTGGAGVYLVSAFIPSSAAGFSFLILEGAGWSVWRSPRCPRRIPFNS